MKGMSSMKGLVARVLMSTVVVFAFLAMAPVARASFIGDAASLNPQGDVPMLPDPVQLVIGAAVTFLVVNGLKDFSNFVGRDLSGWGTIVAAGITAIVVFSINTLLQVAVTIDPSLVPRVNAFLQILVILLGAMGFKRTLSTAR